MAREKYSPLQEDESAEEPEEQSAANTLTRRELLGAAAGTGAWYLLKKLGERKERIAREEKQKPKRTKPRKSKR